MAMLRRCGHNVILQKLLHFFMFIGDVAYTVCVAYIGIYVSYTHVMYKCIHT